MTPQSGPGRRRSFEDEQAFQHITQILLESGMASLSLPTLARRLGITHQSLGNRFESKEKMLRSYVEWRHERYLEQFHEAIGTMSSALERLWRTLILPLGSRITGGEPGPPAHWIKLNLELYREPYLAEFLYEGQRAIVEVLSRVIEQAMSEGLLHQCDPATLAEYLYAASLGGAVMWCMLPTDRNARMMDRSCFNVLQPYLVNPIAPPPFWFE